ncbi:hypothetical protein D5H75_32260 [Bailinhaonella thermotolerans]|uniref:Uncharacterized protein n=2 Tax=Bailinhaonella thermotolerans TaxID=1070861 RepID=A0A3A4A6T3_9ACTN|nr:hypothetical protein D5H75_32260 [Bailinhaonella thermotolerans]
MLLATALTSAAAFTASAPGTAAQVSGGGAAAERTGPGGEHPHWLHRLRGELAKFKNPKVAERHGYKRTDVCAQYPYRGADGRLLGGMGYHYVNHRLVADPRLEPLRPEVLVYVPDGRGGRVLGAAEYFKVDRDQRLATADDRPRLFGQDFQGPMEPHEHGMPIHYELHVWLFKHNPKGLFEPWNPKVTCPRA